MNNYKKHMLKIDRTDYETNYWEGVTFCGIYSENVTDEFYESDPFVPYGDRGHTTCELCKKKYESREVPEWESNPECGMYDIGSVVNK